MKFIRRILLYANIIIIIGMLLTGFAGVINPASHPMLSLMGFAFPAFLFANIAFMIFWICVRLRYVAVPIFGFLLAYNPTQTYFPLNRYPDVPEGSIKVLSYNVHAFTNMTRDVTIPEIGPNGTLKYIADSGADIVCIQEYHRVGAQDSLWNIIENTYKYIDVIESTGFKSPGGDRIAIFSKYPIIGKESLPIVTAGNTAGVFDIEVNGDIVHIVNAHLETVGLSEEEKNDFNAMIRGNTDRSEVKRESKFMAKKLAEKSAIRAPQADIISDYIRRHAGERIIVCGDFNDHPLSYVHRTISSRLTDCFREAGHWAGYSFQYHSMFVRIDNILCSEHYKPYDCDVDKSINLSDHYPIYCYLYPQKAEE